LLGLGLLLVGVGCAGAQARKGDRLDEALAVSDAAAIRERWGVDVLGLHPTAAGAVLDFRYRVVDARKAAPLFDPRAPAGVVDLDSREAARVASSPKLGQMRPRKNPVEGKSYFVLFDNSARQLGPGSRVAVVIGEFAVRDLRVE
jgi:hypothetical protein